MNHQGVDWQQLFAKLQPILEVGFVEEPGWRRSILSLLQAYTSNEPDYKPYLFFNDKCYTKNLVRGFNEKSNVIVMCWSPGQASTFHGHEGSRCFVKVLAGQLTEQQVPYPRKGTARDIKGQPPTEKLLIKNQVTYIDDSIGLHKVSNKSDSSPAVTLHIYLPAYTRCRIFNESSRHRLEWGNSCQVTFHSEQGKPTSIA